MAKADVLWNLGARREKRPPWWWDDSPAKLAMSPNMLNDPAFSEYDLSNIRTYEQDPFIRDAKTLGDRPTELDARWEQHEASGYTYIPEKTPYDPNKVYIDDLDKLKMAVGPGAEQTKQGNINKELASTIAHEFRHTMFDDPKYQGIIQAAYNRFGGEIPYNEINEYINRAAETQLIPGHWIGESLDDYQDYYNQMLIEKGMPAHLTPMSTTKQFHRSARDFFEKVRREKLKRSTQINIQKRKMGMPEHLTTYTPPKKPYVTPPRGGGADVMPTPPPKQPYVTPPRGGGADVMPTPPPKQPKQTYVSPARPHGNGGGNQKGSMPTGTAGRNPWGRAHGGLMDIPLSGRSRYI